jgi:hypothetical protein
MVDWVCHSDRAEETYWAYKRYSFELKNYSFLT